MSTKTVTIQINAHLVWRLERTSRGMLVICDPLDLALEADDETEARSIAGEGLHHFFLDHLIEGTLPEFLRRKGWTSNAPMNVLPNDSFRFDVPMSFKPVHAT